ncbi:hypothetical protein ACWF95_25275 [Streptomyces vinaceus]
MLRQLDSDVLEEVSVQGGGRLVGSRAEVEMSGVLDLEFDVRESRTPDPWVVCRVVQDLVRVELQRWRPLSWGFDIRLIHAGYINSCSRRSRHTPFGGVSCQFAAPGRPIGVTWVTSATHFKFLARHMGEDIC